MTLTLEHRGASWWINDPDGEILETPCGPYRCKKEAESDRRGMERFEKHQHKPGYVTSDPRQRCRELFT